MREYNEKHEPVMPCCKCGEEKVVNSQWDGQSKTVWYGKYAGHELVRIICSECATKPENIGWWKDETDKTNG